MVDVKDIMLGNFVKDRNGEIVVVGKVHRDSVADKWGGITFDDEIEGIEVTDALLERLGCTYEELLPFNPTWHEWCYSALAFHLRFDKGVCNFEGDRDWGVHIDNSRRMTIGFGCVKYVHELQNLVRAITGQNLPITKDMLEDV